MTALGTPGLGAYGVVVKVVVAICVSCRCGSFGSVDVAVVIVVVEVLVDVVLDVVEVVELVEVAVVVEVSVVVDVAVVIFSS